MSERKKISEIVIENPKITIKKGTMLDYVPMEQVLPNERYVRAAQQRAYNGGAKFQDGDTIFARITPCLQNRKIAQYKSATDFPASGSTEYFVFRAIPDVSDSSYVYYLMKSDLVVETAINSMKGASGRQRAEMQPILNIEMDIPEYGTQIKIGNLLSVYDNLIENNNRRIAILEEIAQRLYREWFVHFRFPGHENVEMVDSELGMIPEGWIVSCIGKVVNNFDAKRKPISTMKRKSMQGIYPYYGAAKIIDYVNDYIFDGTYLLIAEDGSVITTESKPVLQYVNGKIWVNNHTHILQGNLISTEQLYLALSRVDISGYITGAAQPKITQENLNRIPILIAPNHINLMFDEMISHIFNFRICLEKKTENLRKTRDHLLPHLISGDIDVTTIEL